MNDILPGKPQKVTKQALKLPLPSAKPELLLPEQTPKRLRRKIAWLIASGIAVILLVLAAIAAAVFSQWYNDALLPRSTQEKRVVVNVESGETVNTIAAHLYEKEVIKNAFAFEWYVKQAGVLNDLKAGTYLFSPNQPVSQIVQWLVEGRVDTFRLTILPGKTLAEIREGLIADGFDAAEIDAALTKTYDHPLLQDKPANQGLEGYIYPETYEINSSTTVEQLVTRTFDEFFANIEQANMSAQLQQKGFTLYQGITLASIIEREVSGKQDRRQVAQVFEKRLAIDMPLGADATFFYAAKQLGVEPSVNLDSPYNTRLYGGLPPGPIANFTFDALEVVVDPAPGEYLYFVSGDDGVNYFSETEEEHLQNVERYCSVLCR
jgi:UPF0755 protein